MLDVNYPSAQRYVNHLETAGIVREITGQARNRVYQADEILSAIETPNEVVSITVFTGMLSESP
jgi:hypothetical protein